VCVSDSSISGIESRGTAWSRIIHCTTRTSADISSMFFNNSFDVKILKDSRNVKYWLWMHLYILEQNARHALHCWEPVIWSSRDSQRLCAEE